MDVIGIFLLFAFAFIALFTPFVAAILGNKWWAKAMSHVPRPRPGVLEVLVIVAAMAPTIALIVMLRQEHGENRDYEVIALVGASVAMGTGAFLGWLRSYAGDETPSRGYRVSQMGIGTLAMIPLAFTLFNLVASTSESMISPNQTAAITTMKGYIEAQSVFHRTDQYGKGRLVFANPLDGKGFPDLYRIGGPDSNGKMLRLIDLAMARATSPDKQRSGYYFVDLQYDDYSDDYGLCAVPATYNRTGINTFIVDTSETIYSKDTKGTPIKSYPKDIDTWKEVER